MLLDQPGPIRRMLCYDRPKRFSKNTVHKYWALLYECKMNSIYVKDGAVYSSTTEQPVSEHGY